MRKSMMGVLVFAAMAFGASTAKASAVGIDVYYGSLNDQHITLLSGTDSGTLSDGWHFDVDTSQPDSGLQSYTVYAYCVAADACATAPLANALSVAVSTVNVPTTDGFYETLSVTDESAGLFKNVTLQDAWYNTANGYFDTGTTLGVIGVSGAASSGSPLTASTGVTAASAGPYSLELLDTFIDYGPSGILNPFQATGDIVPTPEPRSMLLFGSGLLVFAGILRRRLRA